MDVNNSLEDGEILDDIVYTPLERPVDYAAQAGIMPVQANIFRDQSDPDNNSDSDSSTNSNSIKKLKLSRKKLEPQKSRKYDIWSRRLLDETLSQNLTSCDVTNRDRSRDVESYDYTLSYGYKKEKTEQWKEKRKMKEYSSDEGIEKGSEKRSNNKRTFKDRKDKNLRLVGKKVNLISRILPDLNSNDTCDDKDFAVDIANKLFEENEQLIVRIVETLGREKAASIFNEVKRIEAQGGMLIMNQSRRRTPGGIYIFLVKNDNEITKEQLSVIFEEEKEKMKQNSKLKKKMKNHEMKEKVKKEDTNLLTKAELLLKLNKTKTGNTLSDHDEVDNPPPTPETDVQVDSNESNDVVQKDERKVEFYDDDFLNINETVDMETF